MLRLNNLKTRTVMNSWISVFAFVLKRSHFCYNIICMIVPLKVSVYEYFIKFSDQTKKQLFNRCRS